MENNKTDAPQPAKGSSLPAPITLPPSSEPVAIPTKDRGSKDDHIDVADLPFSSSDKGKTFFKQDNNYETPTLTSTPATAPLGPGHDARLSDTFDPSCVTDLDELMGGNK